MTSPGVLFTHLRRPVALIGRASDSKSEGWGFESLLACHLLPAWKVQPGNRIIMASKKKGRSSKNRQVVRTESAGNKKTSFSPAAVREFVLEVQAEFKKVVWPDKKVTAGLTGFVIVLVIVISMYLGSVDLLLGKLVSMVLR